MSAYPERLEELVQQFARLPGIGRKSAERLAFFVVTGSSFDAEAMARALVEAREAIGTCSSCFGIAESERCRICADPSRRDDLLCVVENARDVFALERSSVFRGRYHVLGGVISPLDGKGPDDLRIGELRSRMEAGTVKEVIMALNASTEGETTCMYLAGLLKDCGARITRIAYGLPVGGELEFSDPVTLSRAFEGRRDI